MWIIFILKYVKWFYMVYILRKDYYVGISNFLYSKILNKWYFLKYIVFEMCDVFNKKF